MQKRDSGAFCRIRERTGTAPTRERLEVDLRIRVKGSERAHAICLFDVVVEDIQIKLDVVDVMPVGVQVRDVGPGLATATPDPIKVRIRVRSYADNHHMDIIASRAASSVARA